MHYEPWIPLPSLRTPATTPGHHATPYLPPDTPRVGWAGRARLAAVMLAAVIACGWVGAASAVTRLSVIGLFKDKALVVIDGKQRMLRAGQTSPEGVILHSADAKGAVLEADGVRRRYELGGQIGGVMDGPKTTRVHVYANASRMFEAVGSINGYPINFIVDTGATLVSMNSIEARRMGIDYRLTGQLATSSTASGRAKVYLVNLDRVQLGDITLRDVQGAVHEGAFPERTLLGMSFLGRLEMHRKGNIMELQRVR